MASYETDRLIPKRTDAIVAALEWVMPDSSHPRITDWRCSISRWVAMVRRLITKSTITGKTRKTRRLADVGAFWFWGLRFLLLCGTINGNHTKVMAKRILKIGDRVRYTRNFLQCIQTYSGWYPQARGFIIRFEGRDPLNRLAVMQWDATTGVNDPAMVNVFNLEVTR